MKKKGKENSKKRKQTEKGARFNEVVNNISERCEKTQSWFTHKIDKSLASHMDQENNKEKRVNSL